MDKIKESVGLERQRKIIIKRYVDELLCSYCVTPTEKQTVSTSSL